MSEAEEYCTVVYRIKGGRAEANAWWQTISPLFRADDQPISVVAVAAFDALEKLDEMEDKQSSCVDNC